MVVTAAAVKTAVEARRMVVSCILIEQEFSGWMMMASCGGYQTDR